MEKSFMHSSVSPQELISLYIQCICAHALKMRIIGSHWSQSTDPLIFGPQEGAWKLLNYHACGIHVCTPLALHELTLLNFHACTQHDHICMCMLHTSCSHSNTNWVCMFTRMLTNWSHYQKCFKRESLKVDGYAHVCCKGGNAKANHAQTCFAS